MRGRAARYRSSIRPPRYRERAFFVPHASCFLPRPIPQNGSRPKLPTCERWTVDGWTGQNPMHMARYGGSLCDPATLSNRPPFELEPLQVSLQQFHCISLRPPTQRTPSAPPFTFHHSHCTFITGLYATRPASSRPASTQNRPSTTHHPPGWTTSRIVVPPPRVRLVLAHLTQRLQPGTCAAIHSPPTCPGLTVGRLDCRRPRRLACAQATVKP